MQLNTNQEKSQSIIKVEQVKNQLNVIVMEDFEPERLFCSKTERKEIKNGNTKIAYYTIELEYLYPSGTKTKFNYHTMQQCHRYGISTNDDNATGKTKYSLQTEIYPEFQDFLDRLHTRCSQILFENKSKVGLDEGIEDLRDATKRIVKPYRYPNIKDTKTSDKTKPMFTNTKLYKNFTKAFLYNPSLERQEIDFVSLEKIQFESVDRNSIESIYVGETACYIQSKTPEIIVAKIVQYQPVNTIDNMESIKDRVTSTDNNMQSKLEEMTKRIIEIKKKKEKLEEDSNNKSLANISEVVEAIPSIPKLSNIPTFNRGGNNPILQVPGK